MKSKLKIVFSLVLLCGFINIVVAQEVEYNKFDDNGKRTGIWKKYFDNNKIRYEGQFKSGKEVGEFKFYDNSLKNPHPIAIKKFNDNNTIAEVTFFNSKGVIESNGKMDGKERIGEWIYFHTDGKTILSTENYINGVLEGVVKTYYKNGALTEQVTYKKGKLHGEATRYSKEGNLLYKINYKEGKLHGKAIYYDGNGHIEAEGFYENDQKIGNWNLPIKEE